MITCKHFIATLMLWLATTALVPAEAGGEAIHVAAKENAIREACPERDAFGARIPAGHRFDLKLGYITKCLSVDEGKTAVTEERAIHEACPERDTLRGRVQAGFKFDPKLGYITKCSSVAEGRAAVAEEKRVQEERARQKAASVAEQQKSLAIQIALNPPIDGCSNPSIHQGMCNQPGYCDNLRSGGQVPCSTLTSVQIEELKNARAKGIKEQARREQENKDIQEAYQRKVQEDKARQTLFEEEQRRQQVAQQALADAARQQNIATPVVIPVPSVVTSAVNTIPTGNAVLSAKPLTYADVLTPEEMAWNNSLPYTFRATTQFSPAQILEIKQDGRWGPWVIQNKNDVVRSSNSGSVNQQYPTQPISTNAVAQSSQKIEFVYDCNHFPGQGTLGRSYTDQERKFVADCGAQSARSTAEINASNQRLDTAIKITEDVKKGAEVAGTVVAVGTGVAEGAVLVRGAYGVGKIILEKQAVKTAESTVVRGVDATGTGGISNIVSPLRGAQNPVIRDAAEYGRQIHKAYDYGPGFKKEFTLPSGKRVDAINFETREIIELKPNNPKAITLGEKQLDAYRREAEEIYGGKWTTRVTTYDR